MRIGIDIRELQIKRFTGIGRYLRHLLTYAASDPDNMYVLFGNQNTSFAPMADNQLFYIIPEKNTVVWDQILLPRALKKEKIDVFLTPYFKAPVFCPCKLVVIFNDLMPLLLEEYQTRAYRLKRTYFKLMSAISTKRATKLITISRHTKNDLIRVFGVKPDKIHVVHLAVEPVYNEDSSDDEMIKDKYYTGENFILYVGNLKPHKNIAQLIDAYHQLPDQMRKHYTLVIGAKKNFTYTQLLKQARALDIEERVIFTDWIPEEDLPGILKAADLFVFPSIYEGFGLPILEAMACGTAVITSSVSSLPEIAGDGALYVNPHNAEELSIAMQVVLTDKRFKNDLIQKGLKQSATFTIEKMGAAIVDVLIHC